jgi:hypothetical protein
MSKPSMVFRYNGIRDAKDMKPQARNPDPKVAAQTGTLVKIAFHGTFRFCHLKKYIEG